MDQVAHHTRPGSTSGRPARGKAATPGFWFMALLLSLLAQEVARSDTFVDCINLLRVESWTGTYSLHGVWNYSVGTQPVDAYQRGQATLDAQVEVENLSGPTACLLPPSGGQMFLNGTASSAKGMWDSIEGDHICEAADGIRGSWTTTRSTSDTPTPSSFIALPILTIDLAKGTYKLEGGIRLPAESKSYTNCTGDQELLDSNTDIAYVKGPAGHWIPISGSSLTGSDTMPIAGGAWSRDWALQAHGQKPLPPPIVKELIGNPCHQAHASVIGCENQSLGESIAIAGTEFTLHYQSERAAGRLPGLGTEQAGIRHAEELAGWTLSAHHRFDPTLGNLFLGDGERRDLTDLRFVTKNPTGDFLIASKEGNEVYRFSAEGRHLETLQALTGEALYSFEYDAASLLTAITDAFGNKTEIRRDAKGHPQTIVAPYGQVTRLTTNAAGYLTAVRNPLGGADSFKPLKVPAVLAQTGVGKGLWSFHSNPRRKTSKFRFDPLGRLTRDTDAAGGFHALQRNDGDTRFTVTRTTAMGRSTQYEIAPGSLVGLERTITDPAGLPATLITTPYGDETRTSASGMVSSQRFEPDPRFGYSAGFAANTSIKTPAGLEMVMAVTRTDNLADNDKPFSLNSLSETFTVNGRVYSSEYKGSDRSLVFTTPAGRKRQVSIDRFGRTLETSIAGLLPITYEYDDRGRPKSASQGSGAEARTIRLTYDDGGFLAELTDPLRRSFGLTHDKLGRVVQQSLPASRTIAYRHDANGNVIALTPPGKPVHRFAYTSVDTVASYSAPALKKRANKTRYTYNLDRQLVRISRPDGVTLKYGYDSAGRLSTETTRAGVVTYGYDAATGNLTGVTTPDGTALAFSYDGSLLTEAAASGAVPGSVRFGYDNDFRMNSLSVNGVDPIEYGYDADGILTKAGALTLTPDPANGLLTATSLGEVTESYSYDGFGQVSVYEAKYQATVLLRTEYTYDRLGRITQKKDIRGGATDVFDYAYDDAGRLAEVKRNGTTTASYGYDANGNRTRVDGATVAGYDAQDRLLDHQGTAYRYTANGELQQKTANGTTTRYGYDELGNLRKVTLPDARVIEYLIDGRNRRIGRKIDGNLSQGLLWQDQLRPVAELDGTGKLVSRFVYANGVNVPDYLIRSGDIYRIVKDHLGSPRLVVNVVTGAVAQEIRYDEWGKVLSDSNPGFQPFGFAGGLYDPDTGLVRFGVRDYDAETGRWTAKDPILFQGRDSNLYGYSLNDPINVQDPTGKFYFVPVLIAGGAAVGAVAGAILGWERDCLGNLKVGKLIGYTFGGALIGAGAGAIAGHILTVTGFLPASVPELAVGAEATSSWAGRVVQVAEARGLDPSLKIITRGPIVRPPPGL
ncbi:MAG: RHS repeat protein [Methylococcaceae bacterium]|nr:RHS repeat protein [Methylococcaceae bacterium]